MTPAQIVALEDVSALAWPAFETARLGGWRLHAANGYTGRANTCWALEPPDRPVEAALDAVEAWYAERGRPPRFKTVDGATEPADLPARLAARGYAPDTETLVMVGPLAQAGDAGVILEDAPGEAFQAVLFDTLYRDLGDAEERLAILRRIAPQVKFGRIEVAGVPVAVGVCAFAFGWAGLAAMRTRADHRRQGLAGRLISALLSDARAAGATRAYLQVEEANSGAISVYRAHGFEPAYAYRYWAKPD